jgi:hypothetical protein
LREKRRSDRALITFGLPPEADIFNVRTAATIVFIRSPRRHAPRRRTAPLGGLRHHDTRHRRLRKRSRPNVGSRLSQPLKIFVQQTTRTSEYDFGVFDYESTSMMFKTDY